MLKLYDEVRVKSTGQIANIVEIDDNKGQSPPVYLIEMRDISDDMEIEDVIKWVEQSDIERVKNSK